MTRPAATDRSTLQGGDLHALARFYDSYGAVAFGLALRITGDRTSAERAVEEAFLAHWQRSPRAGGGTDAESRLLDDVLTLSIASLRRPADARATAGSTSPQPALEALLPA